ncbi:glutaredoxin domain-containing cysteine-rich protein CG31559-like [Eupeodes corollae]|uniref:glutaredoxin domain-containing cysteine-rich protein CG31559-like n=1 Tax=Eupeodes corollae TaxID=290404 RepID=UPI002492D15B|nr:glutaredoxin domain-containing cysteine-rich protein CG31559-like [Eupeodes corollae]
MPSTTTTTCIDINGGVALLTTNSKDIPKENLKRYHISEMPSSQTISFTNTTMSDLKPAPSPSTSPSLALPSSTEESPTSLVLMQVKKDNFKEEGEENFDRPSSQIGEEDRKIRGTELGIVVEDDNDVNLATTKKSKTTKTKTEFTTKTMKVEPTIISVGKGKKTNIVNEDDGIDVDENSISCILPSPCTTTDFSANAAATNVSPVSQIEIINHSQELVTDCASAVTESVSSTEKDFHVVKIKVSPESEIQKIESAVNNNKIDHNPSVVKNKVTVVNLSLTETDSGENNNQKQLLKLNIDKDISENKGSSDSTMVQKSNNSGASVTDLNVSNPTYLYYMMSSGQFSPSDTLDSGTCSDMDNGSSTTNSTTPPPLPKKSAPKLEMHLKTTKILMKDNNHRPRSVLHEHQRAGSLTDSEESESSLSCESLSLSEGLPSKLSFLPDSLLRDIRDRKVSKMPSSLKSSSLLSSSSLLPSSNGGGGYSTKIDFKYAAVDLNNDNNNDKLLNERNTNNNNNNINNNNIKFDTNGSYRKDNNKSCVIIKEGSYSSSSSSSSSSVGSMESRKFENDKYYTFHVNEHDFGGSLVDESDEPKSLSDDAFAGYKDIRSPSSATSTIRSSKGTVRGVKNRVRNGIATFLQLQHSNVKNYKEKDLGKVVLYTTSMGIIRETYAKCSNMKQILRTLLVKFEERDVFMSTEYQQEIKERMQSHEIKVPQLFVEGQHIGDADHVERLNESGELRQLLKPYKSISSTYTCQTCGGYRLLPCPSCNGSKKSVHRNHFTAEFVALKCMNCDEVGLVKCHNC